ncbi:hypothetical protein ABBQ38_000797 [Trebouxia sp. C0009 RCD-2024]
MRNTGDDYFRSDGVKIELKGFSEGYLLLPMTEAGGYKALAKLSRIAMSVYYYMFGMKCHWQFPSAPAGPAPEFMTTQVGSTDGGNAPHDANYTSNVLKEDEHVTRGTFGEQFRQNCPPRWSHWGNGTSDSRDNQVSWDAPFGYGLLALVTAGGFAVEAAQAIWVPLNYYSTSA